MKRIILVIALLLICRLGWTCEFGKTYKDFYGKPNSYDLAITESGDRGAYYFPQGGVSKVKRGTIWERVHFDDGTIEIPTDYSWDSWHRFKNKTPKETDEPSYVLYNGHRWYPQYHGIIYVYKDGREVE